MRMLIFVLTAVLAVAAENAPRAEFPQPQFEREQWMTLNGAWQFEFDDARKGVEEDWGAGGRDFTRTITVPYSFETKLSGIGDTSFHSDVWYRRTFTIPASWAKKRVLLHFGAVDYRARVWVNSKVVGSHEGGNVPFWFDITPVVKSGPNTVTVWAEDPPQDRYIPRGKQYWEPKSRGIFYTRTSGIWQPVWLEATGDSYLRSVRITPATDGTVRMEAKVARAAKGLTLTAVVTQEGSPVATTTVPSESERATVVAGISNPRLWSLASPNLYDVAFELRRGNEVLDRVKSYFGVRSVSTEDGRVLLNGRPVYLKFVLDQGYWPDSNLTPPSDEAIQYDIKMTKAMGFNGARKHQKVADPRYLYWADKMGLLVSGEIANAYEFDDEYVERFTREWMEAVERDYNHPSIIIWNAINESWGVPNLRGDVRQQEHLRALYALTKSLDPTRLVIDNEGWQHTDMTDLFAVHDYARTGELLSDRWKDAKNGVFPRVGPGTFAPGYHYNGTPLYLSEWGGIAFIPPGHSVPESAWGYSGVEKTADMALARLRGLVEAIDKLPFTGFCYTQLTDVEQEINGLLTYDRKPKFAVEQVKAIMDIAGR
jgi:beta-galactosidase/beta-glucuronidase